MKRLLLSAVFALMALSTLFAASMGKELLYTSSTTGICFHVPANIEELQDDIEAVILQTPDEEFIITAEAFNITEVSEDEISEHIVTMAKAARIDLDNSQSIENKTELITLMGEAIDYPNGGAAAVGVAIVNGTALGYYITVVASAKYVDYAISSLRTISFDPDAVE